MKKLFSKNWISDNKSEQKYIGLCEGFFTPSSIESSASYPRFNFKYDLQSQSSFADSNRGIIAVNDNGFRTYATSDNFNVVGEGLTPVVFSELPIFDTVGNSIMFTLGLASNEEIVDDYFNHMVGIIIETATGGFNVSGIFDMGWEGTLNEAFDMQDYYFIPSNTVTHIGIAITNVGDYGTFNLFINGNTTPVWQYIIPISVGDVNNLTRAYMDLNGTQANTPIVSAYLADAPFALAAGFTPATILGGAGGIDTSITPIDHAGKAYEVSGLENPIVDTTFNTIDNGMILVYNKSGDLVEVLGN